MLELDESAPIREELQGVVLETPFCFEQLANLRSAKNSRAESLRPSLQTPFCLEPSTNGRSEKNSKA